ncbi:DUF6965 family protein [Flavobacterium azizsancarii]|uniref:DUF6965 family protein n=1 Tax=Flavobacterium azizsancarii TaxID=2961580 RepID=UPI0039C85A08
MGHPNQNHYAIQRQPLLPEEIKRYFDATPPPKEVELKPCAKITDSQLFLKSCFLTIYHYKGDIESALPGGI